MISIVTGCAGMIGSRLASQLLQDGEVVFGLDNLSTGNRKIVEDLQMRYPDFYFIRTNIWDLDINKLKDHHSIRSARVNCIYHLAALADIVDSVKSPSKYFNSNVLATERIAHLAKELNVEKIVYAASSSCYGLIKEYPTSELEKCDPQYPYAMTKFLGEQIIQHYGKVYGVPWVSLRLFNVYSDQAKASKAYGAVLNVFMKQMIDVKPLTVVGDGTQRRDFVYVDDVCRAFIAAARSNVKNEIFNIGGGHGIKINTLGALVYGREDFPRESLPWRAGEPRMTWADISKAAKLLEWEPKVSFEDGMYRVLANAENFSEVPLWSKEDIIKQTSEWSKNIGRDDSWDGVN